MVEQSYFCVESWYISSKHEYKTSFGEIRPNNVYFLCVFFLCAACLPGSLIMHVPISELHAQMALMNSSFNSIQRSCWWPMLILVQLRFAKISYKRCRFFIGRPPQQTSYMRSKRSPDVKGKWAYIVEQTGIYVRDVFSWK